MEFYDDKDFIRNEIDSKIIPLTKREIRILTLGLMGVSPTDLFLDLGAGTGGITCEAAKLAYKSKVVAVDKNIEACKLIKENKSKFQLDNIEVLNKESVNFIDSYNGPKFNKVFIGGSSGNLENIIKNVNKVLLGNGVVAANFITINNCYIALENLRKKFNSVELTCANIANSVDRGSQVMLQALNPVFIIVARGKHNGN